MSDQNAEHDSWTLGDIMEGVMMAAFCVFGGLVVGAIVISIAAGIAGTSHQGLWLVVGEVVIAIIAASLGYFWGTTDARQKIKRARKRAADAKATELLAARRAQENLKRSKEAEAQQLAERQISIVDQATMSPSVIVQSYQDATRFLEQASDSLGSASQHFQMRAFTPFWEDMERATTTLNEHRRAVQTTDSLLRKHVDLLHEVETLAPDALSRIPRVPDEISRATTINAGGILAGELKSLMLRAQTDFQFSSIFEQRRTTAAVVQGFGSLTQAMMEMGSSIQTQYQALQEIFERGVNSTDQHLSTVASSLSMGTTPGTLFQEVAAVNQRLSEIARR